MILPHDPVITPDATEGRESPSLPQEGLGDVDGEIHPRFEISVRLNSVWPHVHTSPGGASSRVKRPGIGNAESPSS